MYRNHELLILPHAPFSSQVRRFDDAFNGNVEGPLEDGREGRSRHVVLPQNVDFDGATAEVPRVRYREACASVPAERKRCQSFLAHGYVADGLLAFDVGDRCQLGFARWVLLPTSDRDGE